LPLNNVVSQELHSPQGKINEHAFTIVIAQESRKTESRHRTSADFYRPQRNRNYYRVKSNFHIFRTLRQPRNDPYRMRLYAADNKAGFKSVYARYPFRINQIAY